MNNIVMNNTEALCGAMWFVAPLILASGLLGSIVYVANKFEKYTKKLWVKHIVIIFLSAICLALGSERMTIKYQLQLRLDVALFVLPLLVIAYYINTYLKDFYRYLKWYIAMPCIGISIFMCNKQIPNVLAGQFVEIKSFYMFSVIGIYQSMYFAKVLCMLKKGFNS